MTVKLQPLSLPALPLHLSLGSLSCKVNEERKDREALAWGKREDRSHSWDPVRESESTLLGAGGSRVVCGGTKSDIGC